MTETEKTTPDSQPRQESPDGENRPSRALKIFAASMVAVLILSVGVLLWVSYVQPQRVAQSGLDAAAEGQGAIAAVNTGLLTYEGQAIDRANVDQKALSSGKEITTPPAFIFGNGKEDGQKPVLDYYLDFSDQRSRDALIANSASLRALVESGQIELHIHALLGGRAYSMYAAEALAEVFAADSAYAWDSLSALLRESPVLASTDDYDEMTDGIVAALEKVGVTAVDRESIQNGTFASWLLSVGNDPNLNSSAQIRLPHILVDGRVLNLSVDQLNDSDAFRQAVLGGLS